MARCSSISTLSTSSSSFSHASAERATKWEKRSNSNLRDKWKWRIEEVKVK